MLKFENGGGLKNETRRILKIKLRHEDDERERVSKSPNERRKKFAKCYRAGSVIVIAVPRPILDLMQILP
jgi:hypothetical protein